MTLKEMKNKMITIALAKTNGNRIKAAEFLDISTAKLHYEIHVRRTKDK